MCFAFQTRAAPGVTQAGCPRDCCPQGWSQAQVATDSFPSPGQGVLAELCEEPALAMPKASSVSESDQRSKSAKGGAGAQAEQHSHGPAPAAWLPERDRVCELGVRTIALGMGLLLGTAAGEEWRKQGPGR